MVTAEGMAPGKKGVAPMEYAIVARRHDGTALRTIRMIAGKEGAEMFAWGAASTCSNAIVATYVVMAGDVVESTFRKDRAQNS